MRFIFQFVRGEKTNGLIYLSPGSATFSAIQLTLLLSSLLVTATLLTSAYCFWSSRRERTRPLRVFSYQDGETELKPIMTVATNGSGNMYLPAQGERRRTVDLRFDISCVQAKSGNLPDRDLAPGAEPSPAYHQR